MTNADKIRSMTDEELAGKFEEVQLSTVKAYGNDDMLFAGELRKYWSALFLHSAELYKIDWLREEAEE